MDSLGINMEYLIIQLIVIIWPILVLWALFTLRRAQLAEINKALWSFIIIAIPLLGSLAFFIVKPGKENHNPNL